MRPRASLVSVLGFSLLTALARTSAADGGTTPLEAGATRSDAASADAASHDATVRMDSAVDATASAESDSGAEHDAAVSQSSGGSNDTAPDGAVSFLGSGGAGPEDAGFDASHIIKQHFEPDPNAPKAGCGCVMVSSVPTKPSLGASLALMSLVVLRRASGSRRRART